MAEHLQAISEQRTAIGEQLCRIGLIAGYRPAGYDHPYCRAQRCGRPKEVLELLARAQRARDTDCELIAKAPPGARLCPTFGIRTEDIKIQAVSQHVPAEFRHDALERRAAHVHAASAHEEQPV